MNAARAKQKKKERKKCESSRKPQRREQKVECVPHLPEEVCRKQVVQGQRSGLHLGGEDVLLVLLRMRRKHLRLTPLQKETP
jgi:hypothetical protein